MLQEVHPSRLGPRGVRCPGEYLFIGGGRAGGEEASQTREESPTRPVWDPQGASRPADPQPAGLASPSWRGASEARPCDLRARAFGRCLRSPGRAPSFLLLPPAGPAQGATHLLPELGKQKRGTPKGGLQSRGPAGWAQGKGLRAHSAFGLTPKTQPGSTVSVSSAGVPFQQPKPPHGGPGEGHPTHTCSAFFLPRLGTGGTGFPNFPSPLEAAC